MSHFCDICGHASLEPGHLRKHLADVHKIGDQFECKHCPHVSVGKHNLKKHLKKAHAALYPHGFFPAWV